jgi:DNA-binding transcriptional LysR family regulator
LGVAQFDEWDESPMVGRQKSNTNPNKNAKQSKIARSVPEVRSLEIFMAVSDARSMTGGAARLGISQAAVSQQIAQLEKLFGRRLFERAARQLSLTPAGLALRHNARRVLDEVNSTQQSMRLFRGFTVPHLTVGIMDALTDILTPAVMTSLSNTVERLEIRGGGTVDHRESLLANQLDMIISADPPRFGEIEIHELATDPMILVVPKGFFDGQVMELEALANSLPMARLISRRRIGRMIDRYLSRSAIVISRAFEFDHDRLMLDAVYRGQAWTVTSPFALLHVGLPNNAVDIHSLPDPAPERTIALAVKSGRFGSLPAELAADCRNTLASAVKGQLSQIAPHTALEIRILPDAPAAIHHSPAR